MSGTPTKESTPMLASDIGDAIHRIGAAWNAREITMAEAVAQLREAEPSFTDFGAALQIKAWRTAPARYQPEPELPPTQPGPRPAVSNAALRREPITIRFA